MTYQYGANLVVVPPTGRNVSAQVGEWNDGDPIIHVNTYQIEVPASILREEGWVIPELTAATETATTGIMSRTFEAEGRLIVNAVLSEEDAAIPLPGNMPHPALGNPKKAVGREVTKPKGRPHCPGCGSYAHSDPDQCPFKDMAIV